MKKPGSETEPGLRKDYQLSAITDSLQPSFASLIRYAEGGGRADALLPGG